MAVLRHACLGTATRHGEYLVVAVNSVVIAGPGAAVGTDARLTGVAD
jgi:hypothetical protein